MHSETIRNGNAPMIRYAQCWEDADILLKALAVRPEHTCLSIASAGDNTLALLSRGPKRLLAVDSNPAQIACLELRVAAYRELSYRELLEFIGSLPSNRREDLYRSCRSLLSRDSRRFWDAHSTDIQLGIGAAGQFERYLTLFRSRVLPLMHQKKQIEHLLRGCSPEERREFYSREWDSRRWRLFFRLFFSRFVMKRLGRDPSFFRYVDGSISEYLLERTHYALTALNPRDNPYLQWILTGQHLTALPYALRAENFATIRANLERLEWHCCSLEEFLDTLRDGEIDRFNLSDIFEYLGPEDYHRLLQKLTRRGKRGARLAYWNMLVERSRPLDLQSQLRPLNDFARRLYQEDKAFFYSALVVEEVL